MQLFVAPSNFLAALFSFSSPEGDQSFTYIVGFFGDVSTKHRQRILVIICAAIDVELNRSFPALRDTEKFTVLSGLE